MAGKGAEINGLRVLDLDEPVSGGNFKENGKSIQGGLFQLFFQQVQVCFNGIVNGF